MDQEKYLNDKLSWASGFLKESVGLKLSYNQADVFKALTKFGYVENITLDDAPDYLPSKGYCFDSIEEFTNGFINSKCYKMYAVRMGRHFNLFVVSFNIKKEPELYYSVTISEETLDICYILELMTKQH